MITLYYDSDCTLCRTNATVMQAKAPDKVVIVPVKEAVDILASHHISLTEAMTYVVAADETGKMHKGMAAVRLLYQTAGVPLAGILSFPIIKQLGDMGYPIIAKNRYKIPKWLIQLLYGKIAQCDNDICHIDPKFRNQSNH